MYHLNNCIEIYAICCITCIFVSYRLFDLGLNFAVLQGNTAAKKIRPLDLQSIAIYPSKGPPKFQKSHPIVNYLFLLLFN
jgi:hypothetical protein